MEGSVVRAGPVSHECRVIDTRTDTNVWVEQYDGDFNDLVAIRMKIARKCRTNTQQKI